VSLPYEMATELFHQAISTTNPFKTVQPQVTIQIIYCNKKNIPFYIWVLCVELTKIFIILASHYFTLHRFLVTGFDPSLSILICRL
jgi:hypothetical protein